MAETTIPLNAGSGGPSVAVWADATARDHQEVVIQTQSGTSDPVSISVSNPIPNSLITPIPAGTNAIGTVSLNQALPTGANVIGAVTQSGSWLVQGNIAAGNADAGNGMKISGVFNTTPPSYATGQRSDLQTDVNGFLKVNIAAGAAAGGTSSNFGSAIPGVGTAIGASDGTNMRAVLVDGSGNLKVNIAAGGVAAQTDNTAFTAGTTTGLPLEGVYNDAISNLTSGNAGVARLSLARQLLVAPQANLNGGWSPYHYISAATTNATSLKASAGSIGSIIVGNNSSNIAYLKLYNKASAPTVGTDVPVHTIMIPGATGGAGFSYPIPAGLSFSTGIAFAITGGIADTDSTVVAASAYVVNIGYL